MRGDLFNSFTGGWKVPLDPHRVTMMGKTPFLRDYQTEGVDDDESAGPR